MRKPYLEQSATIKRILAVRKRASGLDQPSWETATEEAKRLLATLKVEDLPKGDFPLKMGISGGFGSVLWYARHDWGSAWADTHLNDGLRYLEKMG